MQTAGRPDSCSVARAMEILGERWTMLILREAFYGVRRFSELQRNLGIARNILSCRLQRLVSAGVLERRRYREEPERFEYRLTPMGHDLFPAIVAIMRWGDRHLSDEDEPPLILRHDCGEDADARLTCSHCGGEVTARSVTPERADAAQPLAGSAAS